jgi:hypothetical protein
MMRNDKLKSLFLPVRSGLFHQQFNLLHILPCINNMKETFGNPLAFDGPIYSIKYLSLSLGLSELKIYLNIQINQIDDDLKKARDVKEITIADRDEIPYTLSDKTSI